MPSMHAVRKITNLSDYHTFTLHPSLTPYRQTELQTESQIHSLRVGWRNLFSSCAVCCVSFWFWREKGFGSNMHVLLKILVVCLAGCAVVSVFGSGDYDRKKKVLVVCLVGCAVVSVFGSGGK